MCVGQRSAQAAVDNTERIFTRLIHSIERSRSQVVQLIRAQEEAAVSRAEGLLLRLEQEIDDLKGRDAELEQLLHTDNHVHFLQVTENWNTKQWLWVFSLFQVNLVSFYNKYCGRFHIFRRKKYFAFGESMTEYSETLQKIQVQL